MKDYIEALREIKKENKDFKITLSRKEVLELVNEFDRLNNIINELEKHLKNEISNGRSEDNVYLMGCYDEDREILDKLQELKGDSSNDK